MTKFLSIIYDWIVHNDYVYGYIILNVGYWIGFVVVTMVRIYVIGNSVLQAIIAVIDRVELWIGFLFGY